MIHYVLTLHTQWSQYSKVFTIVSCKMHTYFFIRYHKVFLFFWQQNYLHCFTISSMLKHKKRSMLKRSSIIVKFKMDYTDRSMIMKPFVFNYFFLIFYIFEIDINFFLYWPPFFIYIFTNIHCTHNWMIIDV